MSDAIENLAQDLSQVGVSPYEYPILTDEGWVNTIPNPNFVEPYAYPNPPRFGLPEQPAGMFDPVLDYGTRQWLDRRMRSPNPTAQDLSNPSTLATGGEIDYNIPDDPTIRTNIGNTDEKDAFIGGVYTPGNQQQYITGGNVLVPPGQAGGFVGVEYLTPKQVEDLTAGQTPSVGQGVETPGKTVSIQAPGIPNYRQIINDDGSISYLNEDTRKIDFTVPGVKGYPGVVDLSGNPDLKLPSTITKGTGTSVGAAQPTTTSEGDFSNTGGNVTVGPSVAGPGGTTNVTPGYKEPEKGPGINPFIDSPWKVATGSGVNMDYIDPSTGKEFPPDQGGNKWNFRTGEWDMAKPPGKDTGTTTTPPAGGGTSTGGTTTTPPGGGTGTTPTPGGGTTPTPGGGVRPGTGTGTGTYTGTPLPPREPVTPLVRRETVIPTKGTKEVPLPDRQADPFAKLYADLLANAQQQKDQYRYINYDPEQIMNAAMSGFRRRGAMRSLQGY